MRLTAYDYDIGLDHDLIVAKGLNTKVKSLVSGVPLHGADETKTAQRVIYLLACELTPCMVAEDCVSLLFLFRPTDRFNCTDKAPSWAEIIKFSVNIKL